MIRTKEKGNVTSLFGSHCNSCCNISFGVARMVAPVVGFVGEVAGPNRRVT